MADAAEPGGAPANKLGLVVKPLDDELKSLTFIFKHVSYWHEAKGDPNALDQEGRTLAEIISSHAKSAPFIELLNA